MIYLEPPFYFINGVMVYRDHLDPLYCYYLPVSPRLRRVRDEATGRDVPQVQLIKYKSEVAGNGGFFNFDVHIGLTQAERDDIAAEVKRLGRLPATPSLVPVPVLDGTVRLMVFGQETPAPTPPRPGAPAPAPAAADKPRFVLKIQQAAKPSLFGDNAAAFSVQLDQYGAAVMEQALKTEMAPVLVVYSLDYAILRPAFSVRLHIDWDRVQDRLDEQFGHEGLFDSVQIGEAVDKLVENQAIVLEMDNFVPEAGDEGQSNAAKFEAAKARVQEMITSAFFQPSLQPDRPRPDGWDKATELIGDLNRMGQQAAMGGGIGAIIGTFSYSHQHYSRMDKRRLDVTISERTATIRTIYPQGHLAGLFKELRAGDDPSRYILEVDADDPWFERRRVRVRNLGDMADLASVQVMLNYGGDRHDVSLTKQNEEATVSWASVLANGHVKPEVDARFTVNLKPDGTGEVPTSLTSPPRTITTEVLEVQPAELFGRPRVAIVSADKYPWDRFPRVQVDLRYRDEANAVRIEDSILLSKDKKEAAWSYLVVDKGKRAYQYRLTHRAASNADVEGTWIDAEGELIDVRDPFAATRLRIDVVPAVPRWEDVEQIFVDLSYEDAANAFSQNESFVFTPTDKGTRSFVVDLRDPANKTVTFSVTTIMKGGTVLEVPPSQVRRSPLIVRPDMRGQRIVKVRGPADFVAARLDSIVVDLRYLDPSAGIDVEDTVTLDDPADVGTFEFAYVDAARGGYEWRALYRHANGMTTQTDWQAGEDAVLSVKAP
ncbi:hypothetical protein NK718_03890 [Alsobacter sp. SYSU M60028]|uniref:DUF4815 domain-containing protein n=1 Tax=Alsobacter ponti TaxID=2962936 RepID=A0ABT1L9N1_9HYPH|nr:hypothetical protein [Alsobacter ponti]MCP8937643.1 hypothetical protein [Alsobacter ponti]